MPPEDGVAFYVEDGKSLVNRLNQWAAGLTPEEKQEHDYQRAFETIDSALVATIKHMRDLQENRAPSPSESEIAELWQKASRAVRAIDPELSDACFMKGLGWVDPEKWEDAKRRGLKIGVEDMQNARMRLIRTTSLPEGPSKRWFEWIRNKETRDIVTFVGTGIAVVVGALWTAFVYFDGKSWVASWSKSGTKTTYYVCTGEFAPGQKGSQCNPNIPWQPCYTSPITWAKNEHTQECVSAIQKTISDVWPAPGSKDTELGVLMELEVGHGETEVYPRVQA